MKDPDGQIAVFRARPTPTGRLYFRVRVFSGPRALARYAKTVCVGPAGRSCRGMAISFRSRSTHVVGEILLIKGWMTMRIVSHECAHAALGYMRRLRRSPLEKATEKGRVSQGEELLCYAVGELGRQILIGAERAGLAP